MRDQTEQAGLGPVRRHSWYERDQAWGVLMAGGLMLLAGAVGVLAGQPWLFPSLGPTAFLQAETPGSPQPAHTTPSLAISPGGCGISQRAAVSRGPHPHAVC